MRETPRAQTPPQEVWDRPFVRAHEQWCGDFTLELRLRDVPGPVIGDRLAEVEQHCEETGEPPSEAFGDPTRYAREIDVESSPERVSGAWVIAALAAGQVLALLAGAAAVRAWVRGEPLTYDAVQLAFLALAAIPVLCLPRLLRPLLAHPWTVGSALFAVVTLAGVGAALAGRSGATTALAVPAGVVAIGLFAVVLALAGAEYRELARDAVDDLVTSPLDDQPGPQTSRGRGRWTGLLPAALVPVCYLLQAAFSWSTR